MALAQLINEVTFERFSPLKRVIINKLKSLVQSQVLAEMCVSNQLDPGPALKCRI